MKRNKHNISIENSVTSELKKKFITTDINLLTYKPLHNLPDLSIFIKIPDLFPVYIFQYSINYMHKIITYSSISV